MTLNGRVAVVTGGATGIGRACAAALSRAGARVIIADMDEESGRTTAAHLTCQVHMLDVADPGQVESFAQYLRDEYQQLDILVNNAGIYPRRRFLEMTFAEWRRIMSVNLDGVFLCCRAFAPLMVEQSWGRIINIASGAYWTTPPGLSHYIVSKAGVLGLTRAIAEELGTHGITVNAVAPGMIPTHEMNVESVAVHTARMEKQPIKRLGMPEDVANAVLYFASEEAGWVTGQCLLVNGGLLKR